MLIYNHDKCEELYDNIAKIIEQKSQINLKELSEELGVEINLKQEYKNRFVLEDLLLELAIEGNNLNFVRFLFKNELKIIDVISQTERSYHILKTKNGQPILNHAILCGNLEILNLLLENINAEQSKLKPESELYRLYQLLGENALSYALKEKKTEVIAPLENAINKKKGEQSTSSSRNENTSSRPVATVAPISSEEEQTAIPNKDTDSFTNGQFSISNERKSKESRKDFYTSLGADFLGIVVTGLLITATIMAPYVGAIILGVLATCVAIGTLIHASNSTLPRYKEMKENRVEHSFQEAMYKG